MPEPIEDGHDVIVDGLRYLVMRAVDGLLVVLPPHVDYTTAGHMRVMEPDDGNPGWYWLDGRRYMPCGHRPGEHYFTEVR